MLNAWYLKKAQAFAGPAGLYFAIDQGAQIDPVWVKDPRFTAKLFTWGASWFGWLVKRFGWFKQHVNSMFFAHLLLNKKPPKSMYWLAYDNPFYLYIYGEKYTTEWPQLYKWSSEKFTPSKEPVKLVNRDTHVWVAKSWPYTAYMGGGTVRWEYSPICELATRYLQEKL
jgi:hypothetical protein